MHFHAPATAAYVGAKRMFALLFDHDRNVGSNITGNRIGGETEIRGSRNVELHATRDCLQIPVAVAAGVSLYEDTARGRMRLYVVRSALDFHFATRRVRLDARAGLGHTNDTREGAHAHIAFDVRHRYASGSVTVSDVKGDVRVSALSGVIRVSKPGARVEADTASGEVEIQGASNDVKAHAASGRVFVQGNPGGDSYWDLKTVSGGVQLNVPASANLRLSADAVSGDIRTDIPIVVEEQGKHSLRAHIGSGGGRVEVHTVSGEIRVSGAK